MPTRARLCRQPGEWKEGEGGEGRGRRQGGPQGKDWALVIPGRPVAEGDDPDRAYYCAAYAASLFFSSELWLKLRANFLGVLLGDSFSGKLLWFWPSTGRNRGYLYSARCAALEFPSRRPAYETGHGRAQPPPAGRPGGLPRPARPAARAERKVDLVPLRLPMRFDIAYTLHYGRSERCKRRASSRSIDPLLCGGLHFAQRDPAPPRD